MDNKLDYYLSKIERQANKEEIRLYNLIKSHVNEVVENSY